MVEVQYHISTVCKSKSCNTLPLYVQLIFRRENTRIALVVSESQVSKKENKRARFHHAFLNEFICQRVRADMKYFSSGLQKNLCSFGFFS